MILISECEELCYREHLRTIALWITLAILTFSIGFGLGRIYEHISYDNAWEKLDNTVQQYKKFYKESK